ncbi:MAG: hypothetical protein Q8J97_01150, partial [Flavobacteriaceae bacterium]|nr:hypothetical protein [Flavobacteriaceae bacterium]
MELSLVRLNFDSEPRIVRAMVVTGVDVATGVAIDAGSSLVLVYGKRLTELGPRCAVVAIDVQRGESVVVVGLGGSLNVPFHSTCLSVDSFSSHPALGFSMGVVLETGVVAVSFAALPVTTAHVHQAILIKLPFDHKYRIVATAVDSGGHLPPSSLGEGAFFHVVCRIRHSAATNRLFTVAKAQLQSLLEIDDPLISADDCHLAKLQTGRNQGSAVDVQRIGQGAFTADVAVSSHNAVVYLLAGVYSGVLVRRVLAWSVTGVDPPVADYRGGTTLTVKGSGFRYADSLLCGIVKKHSSNDSLI